MTKSQRMAAAIIAAVLLSACAGNSKKNVSEDGVPVISREDIQTMPADSVISHFA